MTYDVASGRHTVREKFSNFLNTPKYKSHNRLEEDEKVYLKKVSNRAIPDLYKPLFSNFLAFLGINHDVTS